MRQVGGFFIHKSVQIAVAILLKLCAKFLTIKEFYKVSDRNMLSIIPTDIKWRVKGLRIRK